MVPTVRSNIICRGWEKGGGGKHCQGSYPSPPLLLPPPAPPPPPPPDLLPKISTQMPRTYAGCVFGGRDSLVSIVVNRVTLSR